MLESSHLVGAFQLRVTGGAIMRSKDQR